MMYINLTADDGELLDRIQVSAAELALDATKNPYGVLARLSPGSDVDNEGYAVPARQLPALPTITGVVYADPNGDQTGSPRYAIPRPIWDGMLSSIWTNRNRALGTTGARFQGDHDGVRYTMAATRRAGVPATYDFELMGRML